MQDGGTGDGAPPRDRHRDAAPTIPSTSSIVRFVDTHVHFWDHSVDGLHWPYLDPGFEHPRLRGMHRLDAPRFTERELREQAGPRAPDAVVHVQSSTESAPGIESAWLQRLADERGAVDAIIAKLQVAQPDVADVIAANRQPLLRGFRDMSAPTTIGFDAFTRGFDVLARTDLSLEVLVPHPRFDAVAVLADRHPATTIVLGHAGQPEHRDADYFQAWRAALERFRHRPNVVVKISALASGADPDWSVDSIRPWFETCVDVFGPARAMLGTNWPIDRLYGGYAALLAAYVELSAPYGDDDRARLFADTATRVYGLVASKPGRGGNAGHGPDGASR